MSNSIFKLQALDSLEVVQKSNDVSGGGSGSSSSSSSGSNSSFSIFC